MPFGAARLTIIVPASGQGASSSQFGSDEVRILRGNTAEEAVSSVFLRDHPSEKE